MNSNVVLHIGYGKTGTTSIQHFLALNRRPLVRDGFCYPDLKHWGVPLGLSNHNWFAWAVTGKENWIKMDDRTMLRSFENQEKQVDAQTLLLSAEAFASEPHPWIFTNEADFWHAQELKVNRLGELLRRRQVHIIVYLRRQDYWVESAINHAIKLEKLSSGPGFANVEDYVRIMSPRLEYDRILDVWRRQFGRDSIEVAPFEKAQLYNGSVVDDFCARLGISKDTAYRFPEWTIENANVGLPRDLLEFKRILNKQPRPKYEERFLAQILQTLASELPPSPHDDCPILSPTECRKLLNSYAQGNQIVARVYLNWTDGTLFRDPLPEYDNDFSKYPGLSAERAVEISLSVQKKRFSFRGVLQLFGFRAKAFLRRSAPALHALLRGTFHLLRLVKKIPYGRQSQTKLPTS